MNVSPALVALMKGVTYREADASLWQSLIEGQGRIRDYVAVLGLELVLDEAEGYAYLRQRPSLEAEPELARLVPRRQLGYPVSLLLVALRKKLAEIDANSGETRVVLRREQIVDLVRFLLPDSVNEARLFDRMETHINKVVELGFLRRLRAESDQFEVQRIVKAFVDAQWLGEFEQRLAAYREYASTESGGVKEDAP